MAMIPHKIRKFRVVLDLSFQKKVSEVLIDSVNGGTAWTVPLEAMTWLGGILSCINQASSKIVEETGDMHFLELSSSKSCDNWCYLKPKDGTLSQIYHTIWLGMVDPKA